MLQQNLYKAQVQVSENENSLTTNQKKYFDVILVNEGLKQQISELQQKHK